MGSSYGLWVVYGNYMQYLEIISSIQEKTIIILKFLQVISENYVQYLRILEQYLWVMGSK